MPVMVKKLSLVSIVFGLVISIECKGVIRFGHVSSNSTTQAPSLDGIEAEGGSRVSGGVKAPPPPWLGTVWDVSKNSATGLDGKFAGNAIHIGNNHVISHLDTQRTFSNNQKYITGLHTEVQPAHHIVPAPSTINVKKDYERGNHPLRHDDTTFVRELGATPFYLHKLQPSAGTNTDNHALSKNVLPKLPRPVLEHNVNEFGSDCHAYGWSRSPAAMSRSERDRHMVRFPVSKQNCQGAQCEIEVNEESSAMGCNGMADHGAPVLCGPQQKLTYLLEGGNSRPGHDPCSSSIRAYHVPHMVNDMKAKGHWMDSFG